MEDNQLETTDKPTISGVLAFLGVLCLSIGIIWAFISFVSCVKEEVEFNPMSLITILSSIFVFALKTIIDLLYKINKNLESKENKKSDNQTNE